MRSQRRERKTSHRSLLTYTKARHRRAARRRNERREAEAGVYDHRTEETPEEMAWLEMLEVDW